MEQILANHESGITGGLGQNLVQNNYVKNPNNNNKLRPDQVAVLGSLLEEFYASQQVSSNLGSNSNNLQINGGADIDDTNGIASSSVGYKPQKPIFPGGNQNQNQLTLVLGSHFVTFFRCHQILKWNNCFASNFKICSTNNKD